MELLQEPRVAGLGVQVLFGFMISLPFTTRFVKLSHPQRGLYVASLLLPAISTELLMGPVAYHPLVFRRHKEIPVKDANIVALSGVAAVGLAISAAVLPVASYVCKAWRPAGPAAASSRSTTTGRPDPPGYYCARGDITNGRGVRQLRAGGAAIDAAVVEAFLVALQPAALRTCLLAAQQLEAGHDAVLDQHPRKVEQARYQANRAERRYRVVDPENRLVARGLEAESNTALQAMADADNELARRRQHRVATLTAAEHATILALGERFILPQRAYLIRQNWAQAHRSSW